VGGALEKAGRPFLVIEDRQDAALALRQRGIETIIGNAAAPEVLQAANLPEAAALLVAIPNGFEAGQVTEQARAANAALDIVARAHSDAEVDHLQRHGADLVIMGEREIARGMIERVLGSVETAPATAAASS
jgi:CPA2 family monovalent cation:H+ antiporter-2